MSDDGAHRTHAIVSSLIRALTHKIRTPLSVISNELESLKTLLPVAELEVSQQRVIQITELLKALSQFAVSPSPKQKFDVQDVVRDLAATYVNKIVLCEQAAALPVMGDRRLFALGISSLVGLLLQLDTHSSSPAAGLLDFRTTAHAGNGSIQLQSKFKTILEGSQQASWSSLSDFFNDGMDLDSFLPPCIDSILLAQNMSVSISARLGIEITIQFSLVEWEKQTS